MKNLALMIILAGCVSSLTACSTLAQSIVCINEAISPDTFDGQHLCQKTQTQEKENR